MEKKTTFLDVMLVSISEEQRKTRRLIEFTTSCYWITKLGQFFFPSVENSSCLPQVVEGPLNDLNRFPDEVVAWSESDWGWSWHRRKNGINFRKTWLLTFEASIQSLWWSFFYGRRFISYVACAINFAFLTIDISWRGLSCTSAPKLNAPVYQQLPAS